jgi:hypothetical protein
MYEIRYHRHGKFRGQGVRLIEAVPGVRGVWTCVTSTMTVTTINIGARSACTTHQRGGVAYSPPPSLNAEAKRRAQDRSRQLIAGGIVSASLDYYKPSSGLRARLERIARIFISVPTLVFAIVCWGTQSVGHFVLLILFTCCGWRLAVVIGIEEQLRRAYGWFNQLSVKVNDAAEDLAKRYESFHGETERWLNDQDFDMRVGDFWLVVISLFMIVFLLWWFWDHLTDYTNSVLTTPPNSPGSGPAGAPFIGDELMLGGFDLNLNDADTGSGTYIGDVGATDGQRRADSPRTSRLIGQLAQERTQLQRRVEQLERGSRGDQALRDAERAIKDMEAMGNPEDPSSDQVHQGIMGDLKERLAATREVVQADSGGNREHVTSTTPAIADPTARNTVVPPKTALAEAHILMKASAGSSQAIWNELMKGFKEVDPVAWPFREGFRERLVIRFLTAIFSLNLWCVSFYEKFLRERNLFKCNLAMEGLSAAEGVDALIRNSDAGMKELGLAGVNVGDTPNPINLPVLELLTRTMYSRYKGFEHITSEDQWRKPRNAANNWKSQVDFEKMMRLDPRLGQQSAAQFEFPEVNAEIRAGQVQDAAVVNLTDRLAGKLAATDLINQ